MNNKDLALACEFCGETDGCACIDAFHAGQKMKIEIPSIGVGTMRTSTSWILLMLMAENSKRTQEGIIVEVMQKLDITPEDIFAEWNDKPCPQCGVSLRLHRGGCF